MRIRTDMPNFGEIEVWSAEATKRMATAVAESIAQERMSGVDANGVPFSRPGIDMFDTGEMLETFIRSAAAAAAEGVDLRSSAPWGQSGPREPDWSRERRYVWAGLSPRNVAESQLPMLKAAAEVLQDSSRRAQAATVTTESGTTQAATTTPVVGG